MSNEVAKKEEVKLSIAEKFTNRVLKNYADVARNIEPTEKERALIAGYFIAIDAQLRDTNMSWDELDLENLSRKLAARAQLGLDMQLENHLHIYSSKNRDTGKVTTFFITGYQGERHKAYKFAITPPIGDVVELIYETDVFIPIMKADGDSYEWKITSPFNRGAIVGAFGYLKFDDSRLNKLAFMTKDDILKRKPKYAKKEFWETWQEKMFLKTMAKELFKNISIDSDKVRKFRNALEIEQTELLEMQQEESKMISEENTNKGDFIDV